MSSLPAPRPIAIVLVAAGLILLGISHYRYGLAAQSGNIMLSILPLLFAGLLLGRTGLWATAAVYLAILMLGTWVDLQRDIQGVGTTRDILSDLLQPVLGCAIVALILDRLILKSDASDRRSRELALICRQLGIEIREKEQSQAQLVHSQRMDALDKLASNAAHDFNNLLGVILGYARQGAHLQGCDDETRHCLQRIEAATRRGKSMTDKLLTLARNDEAMRETFDANAVLEELVPMVDSMLGSRIELQTDFCTTPAWIHMDRAEFEASVFNIVKNAGDAMPDAGRFLLATSIVDGETRLRLEDTGHGMSQETASRIFEPFFTTKPREQGTGIGLAVVYRIVTEAGGDIDVDSAPGEGTCLTLRFPWRDPRGGAVAA